MTEDFRKGTVGMDGFPSSLEDYRVPGFDCQCRDLYHHIRSGLEDHQNHPNRATHPVEVEPFVEPCRLQNLAHRVFQFGNAFTVLCHQFYFGLIEHHPFAGTFTEFSALNHFFCFDNIEGIGFQDFGGVGSQGFCKSMEHLVFGFRAKICQLQIGLTGLPNLFSKFRGNGYVAHGFT